MTPREEEIHRTGWNSAIDAAIDELEGFAEVITGDETSRGTIMFAQALIKSIKDEK